MVTNIAELLYMSSPEYTRAFEDGYNFAKKEMQEKLDKMKALHETSGTVEIS